MMNLIKRFFNRVFKSLFSLYAPTVLTVLFAIVLVHFFPEGPLWPVLVFFILTMIIID
ncbi:MAG: hypothetical protein MIK82_09955 [Pantoea piersonii]|nr:MULTISPECIES: hypothetical protein [Pantoea]MBZ6388137.1 hypothetical protein [Pantoea piersonii]MBZ6400951.1 hypothetical protein [Pantoea piersonii]MBZ6407873.1 hypothetical protein [Pantoea piersonii]MBZ6428922.1 hypothetical protein [Pantoea piersonii]